MTPYLGTLQTSAMQAHTFEHASAMPAATWRFLGANDARIEIPAGLHNLAEVKVEGDVRTGEADAQIGRAHV